MKVELVTPQGYCAGVKNAINTALKAKQENPEKRVFVLGMLVHNKNVIDELNSNGIITLPYESDEALPKKLKSGDVLIFTAHGHSDRIESLAKDKGLIIYDCTCPIVNKNIALIKNEIGDNHQVIYIGQKDHKETKAALSISEKVILFDSKSPFNYEILIDKSPLVVNQTTLNFMSLQNIHKEIKEHLPQARIQNEICAATRERQTAISNIDKNTDLIVIVGDKLSSNCNKLFEIASKNYPLSKVIMVENLKQLKKAKIDGIKKAAISSGASTPYKLVEEIENYLKNNCR